ncbi:MAG: IS4 family transposase [Bacteroidales bacterium]|jgi:hypothetical protein|nr:IS4 family transposase [Bacteroidales bacterium]
MGDELFFDIDEEFAGLKVKGRLKKRFIRTIKTLFKQPNKSIWSASENRGEAKAIYRMLGNDDLDVEKVLNTQRESTLKRIIAENKTALLIQDTTSLNYNSHKKTEGIGYISSNTLGVNIHSCIAVTTDGLVLGILDQMSYNRPIAKDDSLSEYDRKSRPLMEKESFRWLESLKNSIISLPDSVKTITICDREGDIYELLDFAGSIGQLFLIRMAQNRLTTDNQHILDAIKNKDCIGNIEITLARDSCNEEKSRDSVFDVRCGRFEIKRPRILDRNETVKSSHFVFVIYVKETTPLAGSEPIEWFLMTNETITDVEDVFDRVYYYSHRWKIERFHYVLKSGCQVEKLQERSIDKTVLLVLIYSVISVYIMNLTYVARIHPNISCNVYFDDDEWKLLYCVANKTKNVPSEAYSIKDAVKYLSYLGGPKRAPSDGPPGLKCIWIGLDKLNTLLIYREWVV